MWTIIDLDEYEKVKNFPYSWHSYYNAHTKTYYALATEYRGVNEHPRSRNMFLQTLIMNPNRDKNIEIDHINHNTLDNRKENLRVVSFLHNSQHRKAKNSNNKSGYRNVAVIDGKFVVQLQLNGKNTKLGIFTDVDEAGKFAKEMREKYYGKYAGRNG